MEAQNFMSWRTSVQKILTLLLVVFMQPIDATVFITEVINNTSKIALVACNAHVSMAAQILSCSSLIVDEKNPPFVLDNLKNSLAVPVCTNFREEGGWSMAHYCFEGGFPLRYVALGSYSRVILSDFYMPLREKSESPYFNAHPCYGNGIVVCISKNANFFVRGLMPSGHILRNILIQDRDYDACYTIEINQLLKDNDPHIFRKERSDLLPQLNPEAFEITYRETTNKEKAMQIERDKKARRAKAIKKAQKKVNVLAKQAMENSELQVNLHTAIMHDSPDQISWAIGSGALVDCGKDGTAPLLWAVLFKKVKAVEELLMRGAQPEVYYLEKSILEHAIDMNEIEIACLLAKNGAECANYEHQMKMKYYSQNMLNSAIMNNSPALIRRAICLGADINLDNQPLIKAISLEHYEAFAELVSQGVNTVLPYAILLHKALESNDIKFALLLVKHNAGLYDRVGLKNKYDYSVLSNIVWCITLRNIPLDEGLEFINELVNRGYQIDDDDYLNNVLYQMFLYGANMDDEAFVRILKFCLQKGVNPNKLIRTSEIAPNSSWTPLHKAINLGLSNKEKAVKVIKILLNAGADINQKACPYVPNVIDLQQADPITPLYFAIKIGQNEVVDLLMQHGARL